MKILLPLFLLLLAGPAAAEPISAGLIALGTAAGAGASAALVTGMMIAGTAISVVGTVTGSKKLTRFGQLLGLAGGVGAAYSALTSAATGVATQGAAAAAATETAGAGAAAESFGVASGQATARGLEQAAPGMIDAAAGAAPAAAEASTPALRGVDAAMADAGAGATNTAAAASSPVSEALSQASKHVGSFLKDNKELVKLGSDMIGGMVNRASQEDAFAARIAREDQLRADYNAGIQSGSSIPFRVNPGVKVTQVPTQDPNRFVPQRGLINQTSGS